MKANLLVAFLVGASAALVSLLMTRAPDQIGPAAILLFPGFLIAMITSGNVHDFSTWVVSLGNFAFYAGIIFLGLTVWKQYRRRVDSKNN